MAGCGPEARMHVQEKLRLFKTKATGKNVALFFLALTATFPATATTIVYEAYAGSVGGNGETGSGTIIGNGSSGTGSSCTTSGPTDLQMGSAYSTGLTFPAGGVGPCGYYGGAIDSRGVLSQTAFTGSVTASFGGNTFTGSATASSGSAANGEFALGASAASSYLGSSSPTSIIGSAAAAGIDDPNWVVSCPSCGVGMVLEPVYTWQMTLSISTNQNVVYQEDPGGQFGVVLLMADVGVTGAEQAFYSSAGGSNVPYWSCPYNPVCPAFTAGPGSLSGTSTFSFAPYRGSITLGAGSSTTMDEQVEFAISAYSNTTADPSATLTAVNWVDANGHPVSGVTLTTSEGIYANGGYTEFSSAAPEPASIILCVIGTLGGICLRRGGSKGRFI